MQRSRRRPAVQAALRARVPDAPAEPEKKMEQRISLVTLGVADLERARRFYEDGLGWRRGNRHPGVVFFQAGGMVLALFGRDDLARDAGLAPEGAGFAGIVLAYNARTRDEVDQVLAEAETAGAKILKPAENAFWGGYSGCFADPDGHVWEVAWNPEWTIAADGSVHLHAQSS
jgi:catechol 2,3-dioxygenase-like lactoylglutathione lyase family enzyme